MASKEQSSIASESVMQSDELYKYILETSVYPTEAEYLKELREATTSNHTTKTVVTCPIAGQLMGMLLKLGNANMVIEIGVSTGYSTLLTALTIPKDGEILAISPDQKSFEIGLPIIKKAGVDHKINFIDSEALPVLDQFAKDKLNMGSFDFAFVNEIDTNNYTNYYKRLVKLVKIGGLIYFSNTLCEGYVVKQEQDVPENKRLLRQQCHNFIKEMSQDPQVQICHLPIGNGFFLCRRVY
ncbi:probable caffeoyl-CoA O-methyltransferase At4g26220 [Spinacia oleracea]|uniref:Probable caffeoyl-CoA O-methyltransferase At4g26220 n=1 Tax=Spinacia oleracea TaxID=3562 RepID=A0A9R0KAN7_SPIOL|nr:probable caffeoyl-CoA O-methyltransferase At4g26220 [Spinacia oleracea]XP_021864671.2 probable caffeoyl-CoA O-methyltransferase At4g26220 [Spinacia oleracea]